MITKKNLTRREIFALLQKNRSVLNKFKVKRIGLFGSYARNRHRKGSDLDFLVEFEEPTFDNFMNLANYLEKLFGRQIDILTPEGVEGIRVKEVAEDIKKSVVYA